MKKLIFVIVCRQPIKQQAERKLDAHGNLVGFGALASRRAHTIRREKVPLWVTDQFRTPTSKRAAIEIRKMSVSQHQTAIRTICISSASAAAIGGTLQNSVGPAAAALSISLASGGGGGGLPSQRERASGVMGIRTHSDRRAGRSITQRAHNIMHITTAREFSERATSERTNEEKKREKEIDCRRRWANGGAAMTSSAANGRAERWREALFSARQRISTLAPRCCSPANWQYTHKAAYTHTWVAEAARRRRETFESCEPPIRLWRARPASQRVLLSWWNTLSAPERADCICAHESRSASNCRARVWFFDPTSGERDDR